MKTYVMYVMDNCWQVFIVCKKTFNPEVENEADVRQELIDKALPHKRDTDAMYLKDGFVTGRTIWNSEQGHIFENSLVYFG